MKDPVRQIMTRKLVTIGLNDSVRKAYQMMTDHGFRHLPVTDVAGNIIGILSDRDLQRAMKPKKASLEADAEIEFGARLKVEDFMSWPVQTIPIETTVYDVTQLMLKDKISAILVVGDGQRPKGIVTTDDLLKFLLKLLEKDPSSQKKSLDFFFEESAHSTFSA